MAKSSGKDMKLMPFFSILLLVSFVSAANDGKTPRERHNDFERHVKEGDKHDMAADKAKADGNLGREIPERAAAQREYLDAVDPPTSSEKNEKEDKSCCQIN